MGRVARCYMARSLAAPESVGKVVPKMELYIHYMYIHSVLTKTVRFPRVYWEPGREHHCLRLCFFLVRVVGVVCGLRGGT